MGAPEINDGLFQMLRFLQHHLQTALEHVDLQLEGSEDLKGEERESALEIPHALVEAIEYTHGYLLDPFTALGRWHVELRALPTPAGLRTVAALAFEPAPGMARPLGLPAKAALAFDGVYAYLLTGAKAQLWGEIAADGPRPAVRPKLPIVG